MTQYNSLNVKLSTLQLSKLKSATKNESEVDYHQTLEIMKLIFLINYH